jgi:hypothetical protein
MNEDYFTKELDILILFDGRHELILFDGRHELILFDRRHECGLLHQRIRYFNSI